MSLTGKPKFKIWSNAAIPNLPSTFSATYSIEEGISCPFPPNREIELVW